MAAHNPPTAAERERVRELHARGFSRNAIAADLGRAHATIDAIARDLKLTFDRGVLEVATAARTADLRARRAALSELLLGDAERLRGQLWQRSKVFSFGGSDHTYTEHEIPEPTPSDKARLMQALRIAVDKHVQLDALNTEQGMAAVDRWLDAITGPADPGV